MAKEEVWVQEIPVQNDHQRSKKRSRRSQEEPRQEIQGEDQEPGEEIPEQRRRRENPQRYGEI